MSESDGVRLFSAQGVFWATYTGTPLGGGVVLHRSLARAGREAEGRRMLLLSLALTIAGVASALLVPKEWNLPRGAVYLPWSFLMILIAHRKLKPLVAAHRAAGGEMESNWKAAGLGLVVGVCTFVAIILVAIVFSMLTGGGKLIG